MARSTNMAKYLDLFISESREHLSSIEEEMDELEAAPGERSVLDELFRHAHSLKGMSASMGYQRIADLAHGIEDVLFGVKKGHRAFDPAMRRALSGAFDAMDAMISTIASGQDPDFDISGWLETMRPFSPLDPSSIERGSAGNAAAPEPATREAIGAWADPHSGSAIPPAAVREAAAPASTSARPARVLMAEIQFVETCSFPAARAAVTLKRLSERGRILRSSPSGDELVRGECHGRLSLALETTCPADTVLADIERITDVHTVKMTVEGSSSPLTSTTTSDAPRSDPAGSPAPFERKTGPGTAARAAGAERPSTPASFPETVRDEGRPKPTESTNDSGGRGGKVSLQESESRPAHDDPRVDGENPGPERSPGTASRTASASEKSLSGKGGDEDPSPVSTTTIDVVRSIETTPPMAALPSHDPSSSSEQRVADRSRQEKAGPRPPEHLTPTRTHSSVSTAPARPSDTLPSATVRIPAQSLDLFLDTIGEMIVQRGRLAGLVSDRSDRALTLALERMKSLVDRLYGNVMALRLLPFETIAHRFARPVREVAWSQNKKVLLRILGREVLMDRSMLDELIDPINHLLRNAVDHGIEAPAERSAAGKPESGSITISLERAGDSVTVRIEDDGRGMDPERIRTVAVAKGFLTEEAARALDDAGALMLTTIPGFSTAARVSDLSGRGVGMDVVRTRVETLGGRLTLHSRPGQGLIVEMRLPLTIVVVQAFLVETCGRVYAVPLSSVRRTLEVTPEIVDLTGDHPCVVVGDDWVPLLDLGRTLGVDAAQGAPFPRHRPGLLASESGRSVVFTVDRIVERREIVVKPLGSPLEQIRGLSGATILDNGQISLILDLLSLASV